MQPTLFPTAWLLGDLSVLFPPFLFCFYPTDADGNNSVCDWAGDYFSWQQMLAFIAITVMIKSLEFGIANVILCAADNKKYMRKNEHDIVVCNTSHKKRWTESFLSRATLLVWGFVKKLFRKYKCNKIQGTCTKPALSFYCTSPALLLCNHNDSVLVHNVYCSSKSLLCPRF